MPAVLYGAEAALAAYRFEVESSDLAEPSKQCRIFNAEQFVRWMAGDVKAEKHAE
jgi:hypothetical protein